MIQGANKISLKSKHGLGITLPENGLSECLFEREQINARRDTTSGHGDALESQQAEEQQAQESESAGETEWLGLMSVERPRGTCRWQRIK